MNITVVSTFRNAVNYLERYCDQMDGFQKLLKKQGDTLHLILGYGDSKDGTGEALFDECVNRLDAHLVDVSHGGPEFGPVVHPQRFKQLAGIGNTLWQLIPKDADVVGLVESDLLWKPASLLKLVKGLKSFDMVAPLVLSPDGTFYDTWAFGASGERFRAEEPFHSALPYLSTHYLSMDSVGSVFFAHASLTRQLHWPERNVVVGLCRQARLLGAKIVLDIKVEVTHP